MSLFKYILLTAIIFSAALSCGGPQISEKDISRSTRFYEAAYISWAKTGNNLAAIRDLTLAIDTNPNNDNAQYLLGTIRLRRQEYDEAEIHLKKAVELRKGFPQKLVEAQNSLGVLYINIKQYEKAVPLLEAASKEVLNAAPWLAYGNLGWAYTLLGRLDDAELTLKRALFDQPKFCVGLYRLGNVYYQKKEYQQAKETLEESVAIKEGGCDKLQEAWHLLGMTHLRMNEIEEANSTFETCAEINKLSETGKDCSDIKKGL
ncbi:MAG: tetratricopeptide repeat protein [Deltaproteobacteria bacterium]|nr:tetratricopeptide repeat protein [Deltaproteobacteria bacterium]